MAALTQDRPIVESTGDIGSKPVKGSTIIYKGGMIGLTGGYARPFNTGDTFSGHAIETINNSAGANGAKRVRHKRGVYYLDIPLSAVAAANIDDPVKAQDDATYDLTTGDAVGYVSDVQTTGRCIARFAPLA